MRKQQIHLSPDHRFGKRDIEVRSRHIAVPLWDLVFEDEVVPKRIPGKARNLAMILVRIVPSMAENDIGVDAILQGFEPDLDLVALFREEAVPEVHHLDVVICGLCQKLASRRIGFARALAGATEHAPPYVEANALGEPVEKRSSSADFDIVGVRSQA